MGALAGVPTVNAARPQSHSRITLTLTPNQGPPGTRVTVIGYIPGAVAARHLGAGTINFGGWPSGLPITPNTVTWSKTDPGRFVTHFTVPTMAWLSPHGEVSLKNGPQTVGIQCFRPLVQACGIRPDQASTIFHLTGVSAINNPTPTLTVTPATAKPGQTVTLNGWAPLTEEFGPTRFGYQVVWEAAGKTTNYGEIGNLSQSLNGDLHGTVPIPAVASPLGTLLGRGHLALQYIFTDVSTLKSKHATSITLDAAPFQVAPAPRWTTLMAHGSVSGLTSNQNRGYFSTLAVVGSRVFAASGGRLWISNNDGRSWTALPKKPLEATVRAMGYATFNQTNLTGLLLAPGSPNHLFASVAAEIPKQGAPPIDQIGVYSPNAGKTWRAVPAPRGMHWGDFGGFQAEGHAVWAWWQGAGDVIRAETSTDDGARWHLVNPRHMSSHQLFLGPVPSSNFGQMSTQSEPLVEAIHGAWKVMQSAVVNEGTITQLAALSNRTLLWLGNSAYPVQISTNGGRTFTYVATPSLPGEQSASQLPFVRLLPTGALLAQDPQNGKYYALNPGSDTWVPVPSSEVLTNAAITVVGNHVYWVLNSATAGTPPHVLTVPTTRY